MKDHDKLFQKAMKYSPIGMALVSPEGAFLEVNNALCENFGYSEEELLSRDFQSITHPDDLELDLKNIQKLLSGEIDSYQMEKRYLNKKGVYIWGLLSVSLVREESDTPKYFISQIQDITAKKMAENNLLDSNAELEEFAYRTSHDLRSPLVSSISLLDVVRDSIEEKNEKVALEGLEHAQASLIKLEKLVQDILLLTQTKNAEEEAEALDLTELVDEALAKFSHLNNFEKVQIEKEIECNPPMKLKGSRFKLIAENLISNAIKYQDTEKDASKIKISSYGNNGNFVFEVADNGLGVPKEQQEKLFQMFKRFHPKVSFGSGLGLYMMRKSAEVMGGRISFEDTGDGSIFRLCIPLVRDD